MKANAKPEFSKKWWTSEKPDDIKGSDLEKALAAAEKALAEQKKNGDAKSIDACMAALEELGSAVDKTIKKECDKKKHKDVIAVLEKYEGLIDGETSRLEECKEKAEEDGDGEEDEEESDGKIFEKDYVHKMIKLLKSTGKELNFGFGLNTKNPEASTLLLTRKGKPDRLFKALKKTGEFTNRLITYGKAAPDLKDSKTLVFTLSESAGEPPQIVKLGRRFLRGDKSLKFRKLKLVMPGGQTFEDNEPDTEEEEGVAAGTSAASSASGAEQLSQQEEEEFRKAFEAIERRVDELIAEHQVQV